MTALRRLLLVAVLAAAVAAFGALASENGEQAHAQGGTSTALQSSLGGTPNTANLGVSGQQVSYIATVTPSGPGGATGTVTFRDGPMPVSCAGGDTQRIDGAGRATCTVSYSGPGTHGVTATYNGDANFSSSHTSSLTQPIKKADSTTSVTSALNPSLAGNAVTYTATVGAKDPGAGSPTGNVSFSDGHNPITCTGGNQSLDATGKATCTVTYSASGDYPVIAHYTGDGSFNSSQSAQLDQLVQKAGTGLPSPVPTPPVEVPPPTAPQPGSPFPPPFVPGGGNGSGGGQPSGGGGGGGRPQGPGASGGQPPPPRAGGGSPATASPSPPARNRDGSPTTANPGFAAFSPAPLEPIPGFDISQFSIPPFLLPIYQAAGIQYSIPWEVLAAINQIETDFGRNLSVSTAGAVGWMQFMPDTWAIYGVDATQTGIKDPYNPVDAIFAAARYLKAAGGDKNINQGVFAYNHAQWYVDEVTTRAGIFMGLPGDLVGALTGMTEGRFPVFANARYADDPVEQGLIQHGAGIAQPTQAPTVSPGSDTRQAVDIFADPGAPVIATNTAQVEDVGENPQLGRYIVLQDLYGNHYTYGGLGDVVQFTPQTPPGSLPPADQLPLASLKGPGLLGFSPQADSASIAAQWPAPMAADASRTSGLLVPESDNAPATQAAPGPPRQVTKDRLFADPTRPGSYLAGGNAQVWDSYNSDDDQKAHRDGIASPRDYFPPPYQPPSSQPVSLLPLKKGSQVMSGAIIGHMPGADSPTAPHLHFQIRPAGQGAPQIDPKPILDGWKLLEATAIYRADGRNIGKDNDMNTIGSLLLVPQQDLENKVLSDPRISIYPCGRSDIATHQIDRRVLGMLEVLASSGLNPTVSSLKCGHPQLTAAGNISAHSVGAAADISQINGTPIEGHQQPGSVAEMAIRRLMTLQGTVGPQQIISLMTLGGPSFAMPDHHDHIHVGYSFGASQSKFAALDPKQWNQLSTALARIQNPAVFSQPTAAATPASPGDN